MKTIIRVSLLALTLSGCAANQISFDRGAFVLTYADLKAAVAVRIYQVRTACRAEKLDELTCRDIETQINELVRMENQVRKIIANPDLSVDWDRVLEYTGVVLGLVGKAL